MAHFSSNCRATTWVTLFHISVHTSPVYVCISFSISKGIHERLLAPPLEFPELYFMVNQRFSITCLCAVTFRLFVYVHIECICGGIIEFRNLKPFTYGQKCQLHRVVLLLRSCTLCSNHQSFLLHLIKYCPQTSQNRIKSVL